MPRAEAEAKKELLDSYGIGPLDLFAEREDGDGAYLDFLPEGQRPDAERLAELARPREDAPAESLRRVVGGGIPPAGVRSRHGAAAPRG